MKTHHLLQTPCFTVENIDVENVARPVNYRHSHRSGRSKHGLIYVVSGQLCADFSAEEKIPIHAGELIFIPKHSAYTGVYAEENTEIKIVQFDLASGSLPDYLSRAVKIDLPQAAELMNVFFAAKANHRPGHPFYYLSCLYHLLWQVDESYSRLPAKYRRLQAALAEMNDHFNQSESVAHYAELCSMSEVNFRRLFREYTGMTPVEYRNSLRLNSARSKLQSGEYNVSEAASLCGFTNLSFFIRLYKKKFGHTPKQE